MTSSISLDRRTVLKAAGGSALIGGLGSVRGIKPANQNRVTLIEAGVRYSFPAGPSYERYHLDSLPEYRVTSNGDQIALRPSAREETRTLLGSADTVVNAGEITDVPTSVADQQPTTELPTELAGHYRVNKYVPVTEPVREPTVTVEQADSTPFLRTEGVARELPVDEETTVRLEPRSVTARTRVVTDEKADIPGVPDEALGYEVKRGTVEVSVTPEVVARSYGELEVVETIR